MNEQRNDDARIEAVRDFVQSWLDGIEGNEALFTAPDAEALLDRLAAA